jgi:CrcB protein
LAAASALPSGTPSTSPLPVGSAQALLGGYTTFSAFSLEAMLLWEQHNIGKAALYVLLSVGASLAGLWLGLYLARKML